MLWKYSMSGTVVFCGQTGTVATRMSQQLNIISYSHSFNIKCFIFYLKFKFVLIHQTKKIINCYIKYCFLDLLTQDFLMLLNFLCSWSNLTCLLNFRFLYILELLVESPYLFLHILSGKVEISVYRGWVWAEVKSDQYKKKIEYFQFKMTFL